MPQIETTIQGEWHWLSIVFEQLCKPFGTVRFIGKPKILYTIPDMEGMTGQPPQVTVTPQDIFEIGFNYARSVRNVPNQGVNGNIEFTFYGEIDTTRIVADFEHPDDKATCIKILEFLAAAAQQARKYKTEGEKIKAEQLIEHYLSVKARGGNLTLRQLALSYGFNESYLRQAHIKYKRERSETAPNKKPNNGRRTGKKTT